MFVGFNGSGLSLCGLDLRKDFRFTSLRIHGWVCGVAVIRLCR